MHQKLPIDNNGPILFLKPFLGDSFEFSSHLDIDEQFVLEKVIQKYSTYSLVQCSQRKCKICIPKLVWDGPIVALGVKTGQLLLHNKIGQKDFGNRYGQVWMAPSLKQIVNSPKKIEVLKSVVEEVCEEFTKQAQR